MPYADQASTTRKSEWEKRVQRAARLAERFAYSQEILAFFGEVLKLQQRIFEQISSSPVSHGDGEARFRDQLDVADAARHLPALLLLAEDRGTAKLAEEASTLGGESGEEHVSMLQNFLGGEPSG